VASDPPTAAPRTSGAALSAQPDRRGAILNLGAIDASLREVAAHVVSINPHLNSPRDRLDNHMVDHLMSGYAFIDALVEQKVDLLALGQLHLFLELNALVLCGQDEQVRLDAARHLAATDKHFYDNVDGGIRDVIEWHALHANESAWLRAAGVYIRILAEPELFIEGNHRTGALVMSCILARAGHPPFVLTVDNAKEYLDWSTLLTGKRKGGFALRCQMPWLKHRFAAFLQEEADPKFLRAR
jgi:hypothetical protein